MSNDREIFEEKSHVIINIAFYILEENHRIHHDDFEYKLNGNNINYV